LHAGPRRRDESAHHAADRVAAIPGARGETWADLAHVVAGEEQKIRFRNRLFDRLQSVPRVIRDSALQSWGAWALLGVYVRGERAPRVTSSSRVDSRSVRFYWR
jgi:hypothetical protein